MREPLCAGRAIQGHTLHRKSGIQSLPSAFQQTGGAGNPQDPVAGLSQLLGHTGRENLSGMTDKAEFCPGIPAQAVELGERARGRAAGAEPAGGSLNRVACFVFGGRHAGRGDDPLFLGGPEAVLPGLVKELTRRQVEQIEWERKAGFVDGIFRS